MNCRFGGFRRFQGHNIPSFDDSKWFPLGHFAIRRIRIGQNPYSQIPIPERDVPPLPRLGDEFARRYRGLTRHG
ncbi:MAG: hypothetical protein IPJ30_17050 [Acidobacteria bacterium]|nr:hypothetical protein [Acidobacteriota bacterium]